MKILSGLAAEGMALHLSSTFSFSRDKTGSQHVAVTKWFATFSFGMPVWEPEITRHATNCKRVKPPAVITKFSAHLATLDNGGFLHGREFYFEVKTGPGSA